MNTDNINLAVEAILRKKASAPFERPLARPSSREDWYVWQICNTNYPETPVFEPVLCVTFDTLV